ncbi:hypothetical protein AYM40_04120 [Paraburkholderia phytofirmans OLGA172]|uniref:Uncharacterized protein n=1 Tax=Paraburkholderia phytofirmans OLGA172 TaxID=1417228 RepID=A0A161HNB4_9BURK|nr:hypothetical protein AYM40_04120 [Paraburkholderia phytofirmans OLGA172]
MDSQRFHGSPPNLISSSSTLIDKELKSKFHQAQDAFFVRVACISFFYPFVLIVCDNFLVFTCILRLIEKSHVCVTDTSIEAT